MSALVAQMQEMRQRMEPQGKRQTRINIKRGPGGIVDIEFVAQVLVLKWGYRDRDLRVGSTRHALQLLVERGLLRPGAGPLSARRVRVPAGRGKGHAARQ